MIRPRLLLAVIAPIAVAVVALLIVVALGSPSFAEAFLAGTGATIIGVVVGVPVAFALLTWQQRVDAETQRRRERERKRAVLTAVRTELTENLADLADRHPSDAEWVVMSPPLSVEVWRALSESGDLQFVRDPELLRVMARAYRFAGSVSRLETLAIEQAQWPSIHKTLLRHLAAHAATAKAAMDEALADIGGSLAQLPDSNGDSNQVDQPRLVGPVWKGPQA